MWLWGHVYKVAVMLTDQEKWEATLRRDQRVDGVFCYGVAGVGEFCLPSCRRRRPRRSEVLFFDSPAEARARGLSPCPCCRPDRQMPESGDVEAEQMRTLTTLFADFHAERDLLVRAVRLCGFSKRRVMRLFRERLHTTPGRYMCRVRLEKAKESLREGARNILDVALGAGFNSLSHFYEKFREDTGMTPAAYRAAFRNTSASSRSGVR